MTQEQYDGYRPAAEAGHGPGIAATGAMARADADQRAEDDVDRLLPRLAGG